jgi:hypothetical protein
MTYITVGHLGHREDGSNAAQLIAQMAEVRVVEEPGRMAEFVDWIEGISVYNRRLAFPAAGYEELHQASYNRKNARRLLNDSTRISVAQYGALRGSLKRH